MVKGLWITWRGDSGCLLSGILIALAFVIVAGFQVTTSRGRFWATAKVAAAGNPSFQLLFTAEPLPSRRSAIG